MSPEGGSSGDGKSKQMLWIIPGSLLVLLVGYSLYQGQTIEEIGLGSLGSVKFGKPGEPSGPSPAKDAPATSPREVTHTTPLVHPEAAKQVDQEEMARRQAELEAKLRRMEEALRRSDAQ